MADSFKCHIDRPRQALIVLRHDEVVVRGVRIATAGTGKPAWPRSFSHSEPGSISRAFFPMPMRASSLPECGEDIVISRSTRSLPWRAR